MAAYENSAHKGRLEIIPVIENAFASLHVTEQPDRSIPNFIQGTDRAIPIHQLNENGSDRYQGAIFNFPFLFHKDGSPWVEANSFFMSLLRDKHPDLRPTDGVRRKASKLLDYLLYCECNGIDWLDFSGKRASQRPTYRYYHHLCSSGAMRQIVVNQYSAAVYEFYKYVCEYWHPIDIRRVDSVEVVRLHIEDRYGVNRSISVEKRELSKSVSRQTVPAIGFVYDDGEPLRPLSNSQLAELLSVTRKAEWSAIEQLILNVALMTGARKQSVLTIRGRHLELFSKNKPGSDGCYVVHAGPGTGIDTKNGKSQVLHFPAQLAEELIVYFKSDLAKKRRGVFEEKYRREYPGLPAIADEDAYVFISEQGNCYYMAIDDPRYKFVKSRPVGQVTETIKRKLLSKVSSDFPVHFSYHWLRATFAYQLYQYLLPYLKSGYLQPGEEISIIQYRLHHERRETTENYLKLFTMIPGKILAQEDYEKVLFGFSGYEDLLLSGGYV